MGFFWKGDQLFTKRGSVPQEIQSPWTSFLMNLREPMSVPDIEDIGRFLATSLSFTVELRMVSMISNGKILLSVTKNTSPPRMIPLYSTQYSPYKIFKLNDVQAYNAQIQVSRPSVELDSKNIISHKNGTAKTFSMFFKMAVAEVAVQFDSKIGAQMERVTKKKPPTQTKVYLMYTGFDEFEVSSSARTSNSFFDGLVSYPGQGKIFIGFPTHQVRFRAHYIITSLIFVDNRLLPSFSNAFDSHSMFSSDLLIRKCS
jgi:hypothetical protein